MGDTEHFDDLFYRKGELAIEIGNVETGTGGEIVFAGTRQIEANDVLKILIDDDRRGAKHHHVLKCLRHNLVEIALRQYLISALLRVLEPALPISVDLDPRQCRLDCKPRPRRRRHPGPKAGSADIDG